MSDPSSEVFISYSREDQERVFPLAKRLRDEGVTVWIDQGGIDGASLWGQKIVEALDGAKAMLLMISPAAVRSDNVAREVTLISERRGRIPFLHLEQTVIPPALKYPPAGIQHIELYGGDPEEKFQSVLRSLDQLGVKQKAIDALRDAIRFGYLDYGWMQHDPDLEALRDEPAYQELLSVLRVNDAKQE